MSTSPNFRISVVYADVKIISVISMKLSVTSCCRTAMRDSSIICCKRLFLLSALTYDVSVVTVFLVESKALLFFNIYCNTKQFAKKLSLDSSSHTNVFKTRFHHCFILFYNTDSFCRKFREYCHVFQERFIYSVVAQSNRVKVPAFYLCQYRQS